MSAVFTSVLEKSITAGWMVLVVLVLRLLLRRAPKGTICLLWLPVGLRLVWFYTIESPVSLVRYTNPMMENRFTGLSTAETFVPTGVAEAVPSIPSTEIPTPGVGLWDVLGLVWLIGMLALVVYTVVGCWRVGQLVRTAVPLGDNVLVGDGYRLSFVWGLVHPKIYLPATLATHDRPYVIAHEKAHIRRRDHWWKGIGFLLLTVYWFHPLLWVGYAIFCRDMEFACDEAALRTLATGDVDERTEIAGYAQALLTAGAGGKRFPVRPLAFGEGSTKARIKAVLAGKKPILWVAVCVVLVGVVLAVCCLTEPMGKLTMDEAVQALADSVVWEAEGVTFLVPAETPENCVWQVEVHGRVDTGKGFGISVHQGPEGGLVPGETFTIPMDKPTTELILTVKLNSTEGEEAYTECVLQRYPITVLAPGDLYKLDKCLYMNPLSSQMSPQKGEVWCTIQENSIHLRYLTAENALRKVGTNNGWKWQEFPYTDEEWNALFWPELFGILNLPDTYTEILYQPVTNWMFFLRLDGQLWLVEIHNNEAMGDYIWSIYQFVPGTQAELETSALIS